MNAEPDLGRESSPASPDQRNALERAKQFCRLSISLVPARLRWAILTLAALAIAVFFYSSSHSANLRVTGHHAFRKVVVSVSVDGKPAFADQVAGNAKKRLGVLSRVEGSFARTLDLEPGEHTVTVRMISATDHFDQTRQCGVKVVREQESTLLVSAGRSGMSLQFQGGGPSLSPPSPAADYLDYVRSVLLTIGGSALSAAIAFLVQDFLKSRNPGVSAPPQSSQTS